MSVLARTWVAFAAVGAGLIHLALVLDAPAAASVPLSIVGLAGFGWGVLVMFDERFLAPRGALVAALAPLALWVLVPVLGLPALPLLAASVLELLVAGLLARSLRTPTTVAVTTGRLVLGVLLAIVVVGAVTAGGLATTALGTGGGSLIDRHH